MTDKIYDIETEVLFSKPNQKSEIKTKLPSILLVLTALAVVVCLLALSFFLIKVFFKLLGYILVAALIYYVGRAIYRLLKQHGK